MALAHAPAVTGRIRLLTHLAVVPYRNPLMLAKAAATLDDLGERISSIRRDAGARGAVIDVMVAYDDLDAADPRLEAERHRDAFGCLADLGVTWIAVHGETASTAATLSWIRGFGDTYTKGGD